MALTVETGAGVAGADAYISVADADAYFAARGVEAWTEVENKEAAIRKATDFLDRRYRWRGTRKSRDQALQWPRVDAMDDDGFTYSSVVPEHVKRACAEMALRAASADLDPDLERGGAIQSASVGPVSVTYSSNAPVRTAYTTVDDMLAHLTYTNATGMRSAPYLSDAGEADSFELGQMDNTSDNADAAF